MASLDDDGPDPIITISCNNDISITAHGPQAVKKCYFATRISEDLLRYQSMQLETEGHDQGWADEPSRGLWSWFEIAIFPEQPSESQTVMPEQIKAGPDGQPLTWLSHKLPLSAISTTQQGPAFERDHEIWQHLEPGDYIGVLACAQYAGWTCEAQGGKLYFHQEIADGLD